MVTDGPYAEAEEVPAGSPARRSAALREAWERAGLGRVEIALPWWRRATDGRYVWEHYARRAVETPGQRRFAESFR